MTYEQNRFNPHWWLENGPHTAERIEDAKQYTDRPRECYKRLRLNERMGVFVTNNAVPDYQGSRAVFWHDPAEKGTPVKITRPSQTWLAAAMHGDILPPAWVSWMLQEDEASPDFVTHAVKGNYVGRGYLIHASEPMPALTEEQAMEHLVQTVLPRRVWQDNPDMMRIVSVEAIPTNRMFRNAWRLVA